MISYCLTDVEQMAPGRKSSSDSFFTAADAICGPYKVLGIIDIDIEEENPVFSCEVHGCVEKLDSLLELEQHYNTVHRFECQQCKKHLASAHLLDLHLCEAHDSFFKLQAERKPMFSCFVVECLVKSWDSGQRMSHCVEAHNFPANFRFDETPRKSANVMEVDSPPKKNKKKKKKPNKAPGTQEVALPVLGGGGRRGRGRFVPSWHHRLAAPDSSSQVPTVIEMKDLEEALSID